MADALYTNCGTITGRNRHTKEGTDPCGPCKVAAADYMRSYRARNSDKYKKDKTRGRARNRAMVRLAGENVRRFRELYREELDRERAVTR